MEKINGETRRTGLLRATLVAGGLGIATVLAACGGGGSDSEPAQAAPDEPHLEAEYYQNGNRMLRYEDDNGVFLDIFQTCDGTDLLEQTSRIYGAGNTQERAVGHAACADGRLTESDFQVAR